MKKIINLLLASSLALILLPTKAEAFTDTSGHWAESFIDTASNNGLMSGTSYGKGLYSFSPDNNITVAELAVVVTNGALNGETVDYATFTGKQSTHWGMDYMVSLTKGGYFTKFLSGGSFYYHYSSNDGWQDKAITREEASFILANVLRDQGVTLPTEAQAISILSQYSDVSASTYAKTELGYAIAVMVDNGIMKGSTVNGKSILNPEGNMTRAEVCVIITNLLDQGAFKAVGSTTTATPSTGTTTTTTPSSGTTGTTTTTPSTGSTTTTTPSSGTTTTTPSTGTTGTTGTTTTTTPSSGSTTTTTTKPTTAAGTPVYTNSDMGVTAPKPDDVVAGSGQYNVNVYNVPADTNKDGWITYREVMTVWEEIYAEYPHGTSWTNDNYYKSNISLFTGGTQSYGCAAFASMASDRIFGNLPSRKVTATADQDPREVVQPGNVVYQSSINHWRVIGGDAYVEGYPALADYFAMHDGNMNAKVSYGAFSNYETARDNIAAGKSTHYTRYPAP